MEAVDIFANNCAVAFVFDPVHYESVFVGMQLRGNSDVFDEVAANEGVVSSAPEVEAFPGNEVLEPYDAFILEVGDNVDVDSPDSAYVALDAFFGLVEPVLAKDDVAIYKHEPLGIYLLNAFFSGVCS